MDESLQIYFEKYTIISEVFFQGNYAPVRSQRRVPMANFGLTILLLPCHDRSLMRKETASLFVQTKPSIVM